MKHFFLTFLASFFFIGCNVEQAVTEFKVTEKPVSGTNMELSHEQNKVLKLEYEIEQPVAMSEAKVKIIKYPEHGELLNCEYLSKQKIVCEYMPHENFVGEDYIHFEAQYGDFKSETSSWIKINIMPSDIIITNEGDDQSSDENNSEDDEVANDEEEDNYTPPYTQPVVVIYPPVIGANQSLRSPKNTDLFIEVSQAIDQDSNAESLNYLVGEQPKNGILKNCFIAQGNKTCTYVPNASYIGKDSFTYKVKDEDGQFSAYATVEMDIIENCVNKTRLEIFLDQNGDELADASESLGQIDSYLGNESAAANYNYYSYSAHPKIGPSPGGFAGHVFLYQGTDGLTLNMFFNVDDGGSKDNQVKWEIITSGNERKDYVMLSDDNAEIKKTSSTSADQNIANAIMSTNAGEVSPPSDVQTYTGDWHYWSNTDGGIIGPFDGREFEIKVKMINKGDVSSIKFHSTNENDDVFLLAGQDSQETMFIIKHFSTEVCTMDY